MKITAVHVDIPGAAFALPFVVASSSARFGASDELMAETLESAERRRAAAACERTTWTPTS